MVQLGGGIRFTLEMTRRAAVEAARFGLRAAPARRRGLDEVGDEGRNARLRVAASAEGLAALPSDRVGGASRDGAGRVAGVREPRVG